MSKKLILILALIGSAMWFAGTAVEAIPTPPYTAELTPTRAVELRPAGTSSCAYLQFINVYDPRIGRSYAVGAQAWCGESGYQWRVVVRCAQTLTGYGYLTTKGPWTHTYWSVERCPWQYPYATTTWFEKQRL